MQPLNFYMNGTLFQLSNKAKFLGLAFDQRLTQKAHILLLNMKCLIALNIMKMLNKRNQGPTTRKLLNIRSKLDYWSIAYSSAPDRFLQALNPVQNTCLRIALRASPNISVSSLHCLTGIIPLPYRRRMLAANFYIHITSTLPPNHHSLLERLLILRFDKKDTKFMSEFFSRRLSEVYNKNVA